MARTALAKANSNVTFGDNRWNLAVDAPTIAAELKRIERRDGGIEPRAVVDEARAPTAPLHPLFDWNDESAAESFRREQARAIIRSIVVRREGQSAINAFFHVSSRATDVETGRQLTIQHYRSVENVVSEPMLLGQVISNFHKRLGSLAESVVQLEQLAQRRDLPPEKIQLIAQCLTALTEAGEAIHGIQ